MVAPKKPQLVIANGKDSWFFVPAIANKNAPTITEINAASGLNISCYLWSDFEGITSSTGKVSLPRLLCELTSYEANDVTSYSFTDLDFAFAPQAAAASDGKAAWDKFKAGGLSGFLVQRQGVTADQTAPEATVGQFFNVIPVEIGKAVPGKTSTDAAGVYRAVSPVAVTGEPAWNVAAVA
ncbi:hypothetical protein [uncultured Arthrobacter sp.]|uniref:phage tail tube protein n=1 Tax=uncultured Arthrobacter sp. TaxID=114050 RepID=UPI0025EC7B66|nr:hypothetical protein [uncultured Arthrobacter sp.]